MTDLNHSVGTTADEAGDVAERYRWIALSVVFVGTLMVVLDTTIVNVALPKIRDDLRAGDGIEWVVTGYLLAVAASQPATGWLADRYGRKRIFLTSLALFTAASLCCGLSPNLTVLVVFRVVQGLGGGAMVPVGMAIVFEVFPPERRGQAIGVWGVSAMAGPAVGPTLGGYLVTAVSWHWLFLVNVPVGVVGFVMGSRLLQDSGHRLRRPLDGFGLALGAGGLSLALLGITQSTHWGWGSVRTLGAVVAGTAMLVSFALHEVRIPQPIVELRMFRNATFSIAMTVAFFSSVAQYTRLVFVPLELEGLRGYTALRVGVLLIPAALATAVAMPIGGRIVDRLGARIPITVGCTMMGSALLLMSRLTIHAPIGALVVLLCLQGFGMGLSTAPATVAAMNSLEASFLAQGSALRSLTNQVAGAVAVAVLSTLVAHRMGASPSIQRQQSAYNSAFLVAAAGVAVSALLALRLPRNERARVPDTHAAALAE
jgi:DHA2 family multidrug resistance protein